MDMKHEQSDNQTIMQALNKPQTYLEEIKKRTVNLLNQLLRMSKSRFFDLLCDSTLIGAHAVYLQ